MEALKMTGRFAAKPGSWVIFLAFIPLAVLLPPLILPLLLVITVSLFPGLAASVSAGAFLHPSSPPGLVPTPRAPPLV